MSENNLFHYRSRVTRVVDGDTIDVELDLGFNIKLSERVRFVGVNAPESRTRDLEEKERGSIEIGKAADLVLLSQNPKAIDPEQLDQIRVLSTWINGKWIDTSPFTWMNIKLGLFLAYEFLKTQLKVWLSV